MKLGLEEAQTSFTSGAQTARVLTERWVADWMYCINCGAPRLSQFPNNSPVADFFCPDCSDQFEVKATKKAIGARVVDGAYTTKIERLQSDTNPNLLLLGYDATAREVRNVCIVPKHFFTPDIIEKRPPLGPNAKRAGWVGSNILLGKVPDAGRIFVLRDGIPAPKDDVFAKWQQTLFLRDTGGNARGWLLEVMKVVERLGRSHFGLDDVYAFEKHLAALYPSNKTCVQDSSTTPSTARQWLPGVQRARLLPSSQRRRLMAWYRNHYHCGDCGTDWEDEWSCCCDDDCPECGSRHWSPTESEDLTEVIRDAGDGTVVVLRSADSADDKPRYTPVAQFTSEEFAMRFIRDGELTSSP